LEKLIMEASEDQSPDASSQPEISFIVDGSFLHDNTKANEYYRNQIAKFLFYLAKFSTMRITIGVKTKNASRLSVMLDEKENISIIENGETQRKYQIALIPMGDWSNTNSISLTLNQIVDQNCIYVVVNDQVIEFANESRGGQIFGKESLINFPKLFNSHLINLTQRVRTNALGERFHNSTFKNYSELMVGVSDHLKITDRNCQELKRRYNLPDDFMLFYVDDDNDQLSLNDVISAYVVLVLKKITDVSMVVVNSNPMDMTGLAPEIFEIIKDKVKYINLHDIRDKPVLYSSAVANLVTSRESLQFAELLECLYFGCPVICCDQIISNISDGGISFNVETSAAQLLNNMQRFFNSKSLDSKNHSPMHLPIMHEYSWHDSIRKFFEIVNNDTKNFSSLPECIGQNIINDSSYKRKKQILVDVSVISEVDYATGIQRVTRELFQALSKFANDAYEIVAVKMAQNSLKLEISFDYYNKYGFESLSRSQSDLVIDPQVGDIYFGLDYARMLTARYYHYYKLIKRRGVKIYFFQHDVIPLSHSKYFSSDLVETVFIWQRAVLVGDGIICNSKFTRRELNIWLDDLSDDYKLDHRPSTIATSLGYNFSSVYKQGGISPEQRNILNILKTFRYSFFTVGTIEPRKNIDQVVSCFEFMWSSNLQVPLLLVGKPGWLNDNTHQLILSSKYFGKLLFWVYDASDEFLEEAYKTCSCLIAASTVEGFGLPIVEALFYGNQVLARDIEVFREVAQDGAFFFTGESYVDLAKACIEVLESSSVQKKSGNWAQDIISWSGCAKKIYEVLIDSESCI